MARNFYFENYEASMEQNLIEDLVIESIKIYGADTWYLPRDFISEQDNLLNESDITYYNEAHLVEMYIKSVDGFEGEGDFLSKFGLQIRDSMTLTVAIRTWEQEVGVNLPEEFVRPREGDLIYFPLNRKFFEIMHVEHEAIFYQMGSLQTYDLRCELHEYSGEIFRTGHTFIDDIYADRRNYVKPENTFVVTVGAKDFTHPYWDRNSDPNAQLGTAFFIDGKMAPALNVDVGATYTFDLSDPSCINNIFDIRTQIDGENGTSITLTPDAYFEGTPGTPNAKLVWTPSDPDLTYYYGDPNAGAWFMGYEIHVGIDRLNVDDYDVLADNSTIESEADNILDFSEMNPFGEDNF